mgnify:CR=1 FL=1
MQASHQHTPSTPLPRVRLGPRPLPLYLGLAGTTFLGSLAASHALKSEWPSWNSSSPDAPPLPPRLQRLSDDLDALLAGAPLSDLADAVAHEACRRFGDFLEGVQRYRHHPYRRRLHDPPAIWQRGGVCLRDYTLARFRNDPAAIPLVAVPSLINRGYILDLNGRRSLMRHLARHGLHPLLLDWGDPGPEEQPLDLSGYITDRLIPALEAACERAGRPVVVLGYCMGGLLSLAACLRRPDLVAGFVALATPWDFSAHDGPGMAVFREAIPWILSSVDTMGALPVDILQVMFSGLEPGSITRKFQSFAHMAPDSPKTTLFVGMEDWVNDGVPLVRAVARECLGDWYCENTTGRGCWQVGGLPVRPEELAIPSLFLIPERDRIVPPESARALAAKVSGATILHVSLGHIGMITGSGAGRQVYSPMTRWLKRNFASQ